MSMSGGGGPMVRNQILSQLQSRVGGGVPSTGIQPPTVNLNNPSLGGPLGGQTGDGGMHANGGPMSSLTSAPPPMGFQFPGLMNFDRPGQSQAYGNSASMGGLSSMFGMPQQDPSKMYDIANGGQGLIDLLKAGAAKPGQYHMDIGPVPKVNNPTAGNRSNGGFDPTSLLGPILAGISFL